MNLFDLCVKDLENSIDKLKKFQKKFTSTISTKTRNFEQQSLQYLQGIFLDDGTILATADHDGVMLWAISP